jgi:hypothetical protein
MPWATFARSTNRCFGFAVLVIVGAFVIAGCAQNAQGISPVAAKSGGTVASISKAARSANGTATARGHAAGGGGGGGASTPVANHVSTECPTRGEGGDNLPALCAPPPSSASRPHVPGPASPSGTPIPIFTLTPSPTSCSALNVESVSPAQGAEIGGDTVTINGTGFGSSLQVFFGGTPVKTQTVESATEISVTTPTGPSGGGTVEITMDCSGTTLSFGPAVTFTYETSPVAPVGTPPSSPATLSPQAG